MLFNSVKFIIFFPIIACLYFTVPKKFKNILLLAASYYFYMCWIPKYAILIFFSTASTYITALIIDNTQDTKRRKIALAISIIVNLGILFVFKYFNFFFSIFEQAFQYLGLETIHLQSSLLLPVGISFYTFQGLGYAIDVYRKDIKHERNFLNYALFVSFFPQLVAGPIERSTNLLPQFKETHKFDYDRTVEGLRIMAIGMFKKVVVADTISIYVDQVFNNVAMYKGLTLLVAIFLFTIQIYCDFSGYSDIAVGVAKIFGFNLMENFKTPYLAHSISDFWSRWHISLSTWFKDYLYIPLGGNRKGKIRKNINLFIIFLVSGLWHGASAHFVIWGMLHGTFRVVEEHLKFWIKPIQYKSSWISKIGQSFKIGSTFLLVSFAWIFFRANCVSDALFIIRNMFTNISLPQLIFDTSSIVASKMIAVSVFKYFYVLLVVTVIIVLVVGNFYRACKFKNQNLSNAFTKIILPVRWLIYWCMGVSIIFCFWLQNWLPSR